MPLEGLYGTLGGLWGEATDEALYPAYAVILAGQGLMLAPGGYERSMGQQFAAKLSTSGTTENDRLGEQQLLINDWSGGEGLTRHGTDPASDRYRRGAGINIYDEDSVVGLGPYMAAPAALQTAFNGITAMAVYRDMLMLGRDDGKVYRWNGTSLDLAGDTGKTTGGVTAFGTIQNNLYIGNGQDGDVWRWLGTTLLTNFASNFTVAGFDGGTITGVTVLVGDTRNRLGAVAGFYGARSSNAGLVGLTANTGGTTDADTDTNALISPDAGITVLLPFGQGYVAVGTNSTERYSRIYTSNNANPLVWTHQATIRDMVLVSGAVVGRSAFFGDAIQGKIWRWDGSSLTLFQELGSDLAPYTGSITSMAAWRGALWCAIKDTDNTCALLRVDEDGTMSRPVTGLSGTTNGHLAVFNDQLHYATQATGAAKVFRTDGTYAAGGWVESPMMNANLDGTGKLWLGVKVSHSALAANQSVQVQYQLNDTGAWTTLGTSDVDGATDAEFDFSAPLVADQIGFKLVLAGTAGSATPLRVFSLAAKYLPSPEPRREWDLRVLLHGTTVHPMPRSDGTSEPLLGEELSDYIWSLIEAGTPVAYLDIDRTEYTVTIDEYSEHFSNPLQAAATSIGWELEGKLRLQEA